MSGELRELGAGVHVVEAKQRFVGLELGARMTVLNLGDELLVHSPVAVDPEIIRPLGTPRWVLAPNLYHHLYVGPWVEAGFEGWAAPGLPDKRPDLSFTGVVEQGSQPFGEDLEVMTLRCFPMTNEVVVLHKPSRTLVVTDLVFNFGPEAPWLTRFGLWCAWGYPGCRTTLLERVGFKRDVAREEMAAISTWDFDRLIMAHGRVIETGGREAFVEAFRWLGIGDSTKALTS